MRATAMVKMFVVAAAALFAWNVNAESASFNVETRVGNGYWMNSTVTLDSNGGIKGTTTLKNCNNVFGFTGGVFAVALDDNNEAVYSTEIHSFGINACGFKKSVSRTVTWSDTIPAEYLPRVAKLAVLQVHNPSYRVWTWIYQNRDQIIKHASYVKDLYEKIRNQTLTAQDVAELIAAHIN